MKNLSSPEKGITLKIAILGAGNVGQALARKWAVAGHEITLGVRNPGSEKIAALLTDMPDISAIFVKEAANIAEVILIALPIPAVVEVLKQIENLAGKIVIDATNAVFQKPAPYHHTFEAVLAMTGCMDVVKCFNSTGFENMANPQYGEMFADMFMAGSSSKAKLAASKLAMDAGFAECYDFGGDDKVGLLEQFALNWINLAIMQKQGRTMAFKVLKR